jgi:hypothetical protein
VNVVFVQRLAVELELMAGVGTQPGYVSNPALSSIWTSLTRRDTRKRI